MRSKKFICIFNLFKGFDTIRSKPYVSKIGFRIQKDGTNVVVSSIERGGIAEKQGLSLGDRILSINHETFNMAADISLFLIYTADKDSLVMQTHDSIYTFYE